VDEVLAYGMTPAHMAPGVALRVVLVEHMVFTAIVDQSVGIVDPVLFRREMVAGAEFFLEGSLGKTLEGYQNKDEEKANLTHHKIFPPN
jgi:hypothetical protein